MNKIYCLLSILLFFSACRTIKPERPDEFYSNAALNPPVSTINIPIELDVKKLEKLFNKEFTGVIYSDTSFTDNDHDNLKLKAYKRENITFTIENGLLSYRVPLLVEITKKFNLTAFGLSVSDTKDATASIALNFKTKLTVNRDWSISSYTTSGGYEWITAPTLRLGAMSVPLPVISDVLLESNLGTITQEIDAAIRESLDLRSLASAAWKEIQNPLRVSQDPPLWLRVQPRDAAAIPLQASQEGFRETVGIHIVAELYYGTPPEIPVNSELPPLKITSRIAEGFRVSLMSEIPFSEINAIAKQQLAGYTMKQGKYTLKVEDAELFGNGDKLVIAAQVSGSIKGTVYLSGTPWYDQLTSTLRIRELDFDIRTKNTLVKSASWLLRGGITGKISENLSFPVGDLLTRAKTEMSSYLSREQPFGYFTLSGSLDQLDIDKILITRESVKVLFTFSGNLKVRLRE